MDSLAQQATGKHGGRVKYLIAAVLVVIAVAVLIFTSMQGSMVYYVTVPELLAQGSQQSELVRVAGNVTGFSATTVTDGVRRFTLTDGNATVPVMVRGALPDAVQNGVTVIAEGKLRDDGVFDATQVLTKCPSKYEGRVE